MGGNTSRVRADFEGLLALAESLQRSLEEHTDSHRRLSVAQQGNGFLMWLELATAFFFTMARVPFLSPTHNQPFPIQVAIVLGVLASAFVASACYLYSSFPQSRSLRRVIQMDSRDLTEVVELLREIEPVVAREESLSALERVQIRIRLSRFGVGSSLRSSATTASKELEADFHARAARVDQELAKPF